jgi:hypothetical protein
MIFSMSKLSSTNNNQMRNPAFFSGSHIRRRPQEASYDVTGKGFRRGVHEVRRRRKTRGKRRSAEKEPFMQ